MLIHGAFEYFEEVVVIKYNEHEDLDDLFFRQGMSRFDTRFFEGRALEFDRRIRLAVQDIKQGEGESFECEFLIVVHRAAMLYRLPE